MTTKSISRNLSVLRTIDIFGNQPEISEALVCLKKDFDEDFDCIEERVCVSKALDVNKGILNFITRSSSQDIPQARVKEAVELVEIILRNHPRATDLKINEFLIWSVNSVFKNMQAAMKRSILKLAHLALTICPLTSVNWLDIIEPLKNYILNFGKPATVIEIAFLLLAEICDSHPEHMTNHIAWFLAAIKRCFNIKNNKEQFPTAAFYGLIGLLSHFPIDDENTLEFVHNQLLINMKIKSQAKQRNTGARVAGELFQKHTHHFATFISRNHSTWHKLLLEWIAEGQNKENQQMGLQCLSAFYEIISKHILTLESEPANVMLTFYISHFARQQYFYSPSDVKDILFGLCEFAPVFKTLSSDKELIMLMEQSLSHLKRIPPAVIAVQLEVLSKLEINPDELSRQCVSLMSDFPLVSGNEQMYCLRSLERTFLHWNAEDENFKFHLNVIIYQTLLRCCAGPIQADVELLDDAKLTSYKNYLPLWKHLLTVSNQESKRLVFECFTNNFLDIVKKLNLSLSCISFESSDPSIALEAECPTDFQIFVNLVDLFQEAISLCDQDSIILKAPEILTTMMNLATVSPMISGFIKVITSCFTTTMSHPYWVGAAMPGFQTFLGQVIKRTSSQKDELLFSSLCLILSSPSTYILPHIHDLYKIPVTTTRTAIGYPTLWESLIDALMRWQAIVPENDMSKMISPVLPQLTSLLSDKSGLHLQRKLLALLATFDISMCMEALSPVLCHDFGIDGKDTLTYKIYLSDGPFTLSLNPLLNRVIHLAETSSDIATRLTSCQLLHTFLLFALAKARDRPADDPQILKLLLQTAIRLACDKERIIHNLFSQLFLQMAHYFSGRAQHFSEASAAFIESLMAGLTHNNDFGVRDFCGSCLREFVIWSEQQNDGRGGESSPNSIIGIIRMLCEFAIHPERDARIGSAIAFNYLYDKLRESRQIINNYWLRLYHNFLICLEISSSEEEAQIIVNAVRNLQRPFLEMTSFFQTCPESRKIPHGYTGGTIKDIVVQTMKYCQSGNTHLRKVAQSFIKNIRTLIPDLKLNTAIIEVPIGHPQYEEKTLAILDFILWNNEKPSFVPEAYSKLIIDYLESPLSYKPENRIIVWSYLNNNAEFLDVLCLNKISKFIFCDNSTKASNEEKSLIKKLLTSIITKNSNFRQFISFLPDLSEDAILKQLTTLNNFEFCNFVSGLIFVDHCVDYEYCANKIITQMFGILFKKFGQRCFLVNLDYHVKLSLKSLMTWIFSKQVLPETVLGLIIDNERVNDVNNTKGKIFYELFKEPITKFLITNKLTCDFLITHREKGFILLTCIVRSAFEMKLFASEEFIEALVGHWSFWASCNIEYKHLTSLLKLLKQISVNSNHIQLQHWFFSIDKNISDEETIYFFDSLELFVTSDNQTQLEQCLLRFKCKRWFLLQNQKETQTMLKSISNKLIHCVGKTGNVAVFAFYLDMISLHSYLVEENNLKNMFDILKTTFSTDSILCLLFVLYDNIFGQTRVQEALATILKLFLSQSSKDVILKFFTQKTPKFLDILETRMTKASDGIWIKTLTINLIEILYLRTNQADRIEVQNNISGSNYEKIFPRIIKACNFGRYRFTDNIKEELLNYNSACVSFICVFAMNLKEEIHFKNFLFTDKLFQCILDDTKDYSSLFLSKRTYTPWVDQKVHVPNRSTLFESTLKEDVRNFDLTDSFIGETNTVANMMEAKGELKVIPTLTNLIQHMNDTGLHFWANYFAKSLISDTNVAKKLFILKIICNVDKINLHNSNLLAPAILDGFLQVPEDLLTNEIIAAVLNTFLDWKTTDLFNINEPIKIAKIIINLIKCTSAGVQKDVDMPEKIVCNILDKYSVNYNLIYEYLVDNFSTIDNISYVQLRFLIVILKYINEINPTKLQLDWILKNLSKPLNRDLAAESIGLILKKIAHPSQSLKIVEDQLKENNTNTIFCVYKIHKNYPQITENFFSLLMKFVWQDNSQIKIYCLEMLKSHFEIFGINDDIVSVMAITENVFKCKIITAQRLMLEIIEKFIQNLTDADSGYLVPLILKFCDHNDISLRHLAYKILIKIETRFSGQYGDQLILKLFAGVNENSDCVDFWCNSIVPKSTKESVLYVFKNLYKPEIENIFLEFTIRTLLWSATVDANFDLPVFDHPLSDCEYSDTPILDSWRRGSSALPPMFAPSVAYELYKLDMNHPASQKTCKLRETAQTLLFEPTVEKTDATFKKPLTPRSKKFKTEKTTRHDEIKMFRNFRSGDYPDILIKHRQVIEMLLDLSGRDSKFSKELFMILFKTIFKSNDSEMFENSVKSAMNCILNASRATNRLFIGAMLHTALDCHIWLPVADVTRVSISCGFLSTGTLLVERCLEEFKSNGPSSSKKARMDEDDDDWLKLAALYRATKNKTVVGAIFLDKIGVQGFVKEALVYENCSNWLPAVECYEKAMEECCSEEKKHFYCQSYFECLAAISDWGKILNCINSSVPQETMLWENTWCANVLVPWKTKSLFMSSDTFTDFLIDADPLKKSITKELSHFQAVAYWLNDDVANSLACSIKSQKQLLNKWMATNNWDSFAKNELLEHIHLLAEIQQVTHLKAVYSIAEELPQILELLTRGNPNTNNNLEIWHMRLLLRCKFLEELKKTFENDFESEQVLLAKNIVTRFTELADISVKQFNVTLARKFLKSASDFGVSSYEDVKNLWWAVRQSASLLEVVNSPWSCQQKIEKLHSLWQRSDERFSIGEDTTLPKVIENMIDIVDESNLNLDFLPIDKRNLKKNWLEMVDKSIEISLDSRIKSELLLAKAKFFKKNRLSWEQRTKSLLNAMIFGNFEARQLFATVLNTEEIIESPEILRLLEKVPTWMFLMWRNQLLANVTKNPMQMIKNILLKIAHQYPSSLTYSLRLTMENAKDNEFLKRLGTLVFINPVEEEFLNQIGRLENPSLKLDKYLNDVLNQLKNDSIDWSKVEVLMDKVKNVINENFGGFNSDCWQMVASKDVTGLRLFVEKSKSKPFNFSKRLEDHSPWLARFHWMQNEKRLEIPGQYDGEFMPIPNKHILVASFKPKIIVIDSLRQPVKVTLLGNNAKEYNFLVKFGEDLRQDERIQQVLAQMDRTWATSNARLETYKVIPLSTNCGLIEWLDKTATLRTLVAFPKERIQKARDDHLLFLSNGLNINIVSVHLQSFQTIQNDVVANAYERRVAMFDRNSLRNSLFNICTSPEHFFQLRTNLASSLSAMCIAHWLLGVGDRHLDNILISVEKGKFIGIDFGMSFGFATQFLLLPELVPFRLTPQMMNIFSPLCENGWLKSTMVNCVKLLRRDPSILLGILEVFVLEPTVDWLNQQSCDWSPQSKLDAIGRKLNGEHPVRSMECLLSGRKCKVDCLKEQIAVLKGCNNRRAELFNEQTLSPEEQVTCLLELATDPVILGRTYIGWDSWI